MKRQRNIIGNLYACLKYWKQRLLRSNRYKLTQQIIQYIQSKDCMLPVSEKTAMHNYLSKNLIYPIPYSFVRNYLYKETVVFWDADRMLYYVKHNKKKLYFKKGLSKQKVRNLYNDLCIEQDAGSPHSYFAFPIHYQSTDIVVDIGAAEGIWALDIVEKVGGVYLFECEEDWITALQATFEPWKNKVHIINKYVTDSTHAHTTALDDFFVTWNVFPTIIKADIEGAEEACIKGASMLLREHIRHVLLCTYHKVGDFKLLSDMMKERGFNVYPSPGYMIFFGEEKRREEKRRGKTLNTAQDDISNYIRKGLIYAAR